jgi:enoyl-CoA hydratase/carnithine racemase
MTAQGSVAMAVEAAVARLRIENGPLNILDVALRERLLERVLELEGRADIRVITIEGAGAKAFSAGSDVREFPPTCSAATPRSGSSSSCSTALRACPR